MYNIATFKLGLILISLIMLPGLIYAQEPIWDANKVELISEKLAEGVYAFYPKDAKELNAKGGAAATVGGVIVGSKGALMVETYLNKKLNQQAQELIKKITPLPILYAINTSAHGDHSFGNMYLPKTTLIIQHANTKNYIDQHLADDKAFMIKNFGTKRGIEEIQSRMADILVATNGKISLDLGNRVVEIMDFGFAQTGGDLFIWEPKAKVLFAGNPIIASKPALPWLLDGHLLETLETLSKVKDFLPDDGKIIPGHGIAMTKGDLQWHLDYLTQVKNQVQESVSQGLSLEDTVKKVTMAEFRGYVLFDWVHPGLNVPAAYKDLKK